MSEREAPRHGGGPARRPRLLALGYNIPGTGLTRVMRTLAGRLAGRFEIDWLGIGDAGPARREDGMRLHPVNTRGGDAFGALEALEMAAADPPDVLLVLHDIWTFEFYGRVLAPLRGRTRLVGYVPIDGDIADPATAAPLLGLDRVVVYTDWAAREMRGAFGALRADAPPPIDVLHHGVDTEVFAPDPALVAAGFDRRARAEARRAHFGDRPGLEEGMVVLNAARPCVRKRIDLTIEGFAEFARGKPDGVLLCLHQAIADPQAEAANAMMARLGIEDRVIRPPPGPNGGPLDDAGLARLYRACDVGLNTAMGEGWGLVSFEHASTGAAQVVPDHTACGALWDESCAMMVPPEALEIPPFSPLRMGRVAPRGVARALEALWSDPARAARISAAGHAHANRPDFDWDVIADRLAGILAAEAALASGHGRRKGAA